MLFNSPEFILFFLPLVFAGFLIIERLGFRSGRILWLVIASFAFYGYWKWQYVALLAASTGANYFVGSRISRSRSTFITTLGIAANLAVLGYFKYTGFFLSNLRALTGMELGMQKIVLPLGISFFTFQQIAFLMDTYSGKTDVGDFPRYALFISFFPQLIAGPIVHYQEIAPQMDSRRNRDVVLDDLKIGVTIFLLGLFKKYAIADSLSPFVNKIFSASEASKVPHTFDAWRAMLAYTFQIYFDFSGYSDMAIGLGRLFGLKLPLNFFSPYKALNISEFWQRWHITLSRFFRDYLYIPLGGNRQGSARTALNLVLVMFLGGLWHGAGWNFVIWGLLHGFYLACFHVFSWTRNRLGFSPRKTGGRLAFVPKSLAWFTTFLAVSFAWVFFRSASFGGALTMLTATANVANAPVQFDQSIDIPLVCSFVVAFLLPNTWQVMRDFHPTVTPPPPASVPDVLFPEWPRLRWTFSPRWAIAGGILLGVIIVNMITGKPTEFIYFQF